MAKATNGLTAKRVEAIKAPGKYHDKESRGLHLQVGPNGNKSWLLRYELDGRERWMGLGSTHDFSLREARERAREQRQLLADGIDPIEAKLAKRDAERANKSANITLKEATARFLTVHGDQWRSPKTLKGWQTSLRRYAGSIMDRPVTAITEAVVNEALADCSIPYTAGRVRDRVLKVCEWIKTGAPLPATASHKAAHHAALAYSEVPAFMAELREQPGIPAMALEFLVLTAARTNEVLGAKWGEIDLDQRLWTVPPARAKSHREHRVRLSKRAVELLQNALTERGNPHVFIGGSRGGALGHNTLAGMLAKLRPGVTVHGFRASFRTWCDETQHVEHSVAEAALAHARGDATEQAYRRGDMLAKRARLKEDWSKFCSSTPATVLPLRKAAR